MRIELIFLGLATLALLGWVLLLLKKKQALTLRCLLAEEKSRQVEQLQLALSERDKELRELYSREQVAKQKLLLVEEKLTETFRALSAEALERNNRHFLDLANSRFEKLQEGAKGELDKKQQVITELLKPVKETLHKLDEGMRLLEKERKGDQESLKTQVKALIDSERELHKETANLVKALRTPLTRGYWGEIQLKRVVELAGMLKHCDFFEQQVEDGGLRPDLLVRLPGGRQVIVDAKVPLEAYLEAVDAEDESVKKEKLQQHARQVRAHVTALGKKAYWEHFQPTPEFVILFLPSDTFFSAAVEHDPSLMEASVADGVIIATPTTLIALLRAVAHGWKQESLSKHAEEVSILGHELYKRLIDMGGHWSRMGRSLSSAVEAYNKAVGSLETRVLVTARKFKELGASASQLEMEPLEIVERFPRELQSSDMINSDQN